MIFYFSDFLLVRRCSSMRLEYPVCDEESFTSCSFASSPAAPGRGENRPRNSSSESSLAVIVCLSQVSVFSISSIVSPGQARRPVMRASGGVLEACTGERTALIGDTVVSSEKKHAPLSGSRAQFRPPSCSSTKTGHVSRVSHNSSESSHCTTSVCNLRLVVHCLFACSLIHTHIRSLPSDPLWDSCRVCRASARCRQKFSLSKSSGIAFLVRPHPSPKHAHRWLPICLDMIAFNTFVKLEEGQFPR
jgi:hypothetical protein